MRPIEFRGKRIDNGEWVYGDLITDGKMCYIFPFESGLFEFNSKLVKVNFSTVGQFTGLTDKNGKKIFEGDKLLCYHNEFDIVFGAVVFFDNSTFMLYEILEDGTKKAFRYWNDGIHDWYSMEQFDSFEFEIIGNIHDNPELLNQQQ